MFQYNMYNVIIKLGWLFLLIDFILFWYYLNTEIASEPHFPVQEILNKFTEKWKVGCWKCMTEFFTPNITTMPQGMNTIHTLEG